VDEVILKAKEKARNFLFEDIANLRAGIENEEKDIIFPDLIEDEQVIALRLEAHAYLAHKNIHSS